MSEDQCPEAVLSQLGAVAVRSAATALIVVALVLGGYTVARRFAPDNNSSTGELTRIPTGLDELVRFAASNDGPVDLIVVGRVAGVDHEGEQPLIPPEKVQPGLPSPAFPYTDLLVDVEEVLAGTSVATRLRLREPGHASAANGSSSSPIPRAGQRLILLLNLRPGGDYYTAHPYAKIDVSGPVPVFNDGKRTPISGLNAPTAPADLAREIAAVAGKIRP